MYDGTVGAAIVHCKHLYIVKSRKLNPPAYCELWEEATGSPMVPESGRPSCLIISPSLSVLSLLNRISLQLTECHASEGSLISPASQTFYLSILLSSKGHIFTFTPAQSTCGTAQLFLSLQHIPLSDFSLGKRKREKKKLIDHCLGPGFVPQSPWRYFWWHLKLFTY